MTQVPHHTQEPADDTLYNEFNDSERWQDRLYRKLCHKSLNIRDNDDMIHVDNRKTGFSPKAVLGIGLAAAGLPIAGALVNNFLADDGPQLPPTQIIQPVTEVQKTITEGLEFGLGTEEEYLK